MKKIRARSSKTIWISEKTHEILSREKWRFRMSIGKLVEVALNSYLKSNPEMKDYI